MYLEENKELADGMNHLEIRLGDHGYVQVDRTWHSEQVCSPFPVCTSSGGGRGCCA